MSSPESQIPDSVIEKQLHAGFTQWSSDHSDSDQSIGTLPYWPNIFSDQRLDKPHRPINRMARLIQRHENENGKKRVAVYLGKLAAIEVMRKVHAKSVGSRELADEMVGAFLEQPYDEGLSTSLAEYTLNCLDDEPGHSIGIACGHLERLSDIGDFGGAQTLAMIELSGFKYIDRPGALINKNMTRQRHHQIPLPWLMSIGGGGYYGVPAGTSAERYNITGHILARPNAIVGHKIITDIHKQNIILTYAPVGSRAERRYAGWQLDHVIIGSPVYTAPIAVRLGGGVIPANRYGNEFKIGQVIRNVRAEGVRKKEHEKVLSDSVIKELAQQAHELTGVSVSYHQSHPAEHMALVEEFDGKL